MLGAIIVILIILWFFGYSPISVSVPNIVLFTINNHPVTLWEILILAVVSWAISILPRPLQTAASVLLVLWILSVLGIFAIAGLPNIIVLVIIVGLILSIFL